LRTISIAAIYPDVSNMLWPMSGAIAQPAHDRSVIIVPDVLEGELDRIIQLV
jgi:hypothetical protein